MRPAGTLLAAHCADGRTPSATPKPLLHRPATLFPDVLLCGPPQRVIDDDVVEVARLQIFRTARLEGFVILAHCFMPDHAHLLVEGMTDSADLRRFAKLAKQRSGALYARRARRALWQKGYYERVLRERDDPGVIAQYILENPVRAGLVANACDYPHAGCDLSGPRCTDTRAYRETAARRMSVARR